MSTMAELERKKAEIRRRLKANGTNVERNDLDQYGDGDQSLLRLSNKKKQVYRDLFSEGGDIFEHLSCSGFSPFVLLCLLGNAKKVREELEAIDTMEQATAPPAELIHLLEKREASMRLSPLLALVAAGKNFALQDPRGGSMPMSEGQIEVARVLLSFGARPDARDVVGKTVCHYGAGAMATDTTLKIVGMCIQAAGSSHLFGKEVELHGLSTESMNGKRGIARGYDTLSGRRTVLLTSVDVGGNMKVGIKPENLRLVSVDSSMGSMNLSPPVKLCDIPDRLGAVSLLEVIMSDRMDVAEFLLCEHEASIDVEDLDGCSAKSMSLLGGGQLVSRVARLVMDEATKREKMNLKAWKCAHCGKPETDDLKLNRCARCRVARYCSKDCQTTHWKAGHKVECKRLAEEKETGIRLGKPAETTGGSMMFNMRSGAAQKPGGFRRPRGTAVNEKFFIKAQATPGDLAPILIYDETRSCTFELSPYDEGFKELLKVVRAEAAFSGRKAYLKASFDSDGFCTIYPGTRTIKKW